MTQRVCVQPIIIVMANGESLCGIEAFGGLRRLMAAMRGAFGGPAMCSGFPGASQEPLLNTLGHDPASGGAVPASATPVPKPRNWSATSTGDSPPGKPSGTSKAEHNFALVMRRCGFPLNSNPAQPGGPTVLPLVCGPSGHVGPTPPQAEALGMQNLHQAVEAYSSQGPSPSLESCGST